jgi:hypothetical protein
MKNKKILWTALPFLAGAIFGISLLGLLSFTGQSKSALTDPVVTKISVTDAHTYFQNYYKNATMPASKIKGFVIDKEDLTAMNIIMGATPSAAGFRVYFGTDANGAGILIMCGVDANGYDMTGNVYSATTNRVGPCPPVCDVNSPISGQ